MTRASCSTRGHHSNIKVRSVCAEERSGGVMGRPLKENVVFKFDVRLTAEQKQQVQTAAARAGMPASVGFLHLIGEVAVHEPAEKKR